MTTAAAARPRHLHEHPVVAGLAHAAGLVMFLALPWQVALVAVTLVWLGLWKLLTKLPGAAAARAAGRRALERAAPVFLTEKENAPYLLTTFGLGLFIPAVLGVSLWYQLAVVGVGSGVGVDWVAVFVYHALWLGPNHLFFGHVATLIHHHGHQKRIFRQRFRWLDHYIVYGLGTLYGHIPENYPVGHLRNHHKYDNGPLDLTSTRALDRGSFRGWLSYRAQFLLFWSGLSVIHFNAVRGKRRYARQQARGTLFFYGIALAFGLYDLELAFAYFVLPHIVILNFISAINFTWHMLIDPDDPQNTYTNSLTILDAQQDVWNEAHHISHHLRPQAVWTRMPDHFDDRQADYVNAKANVFRDTQVFEIFALVMLGKVDELAKRYVDLSGEMSQDEIVALLKHRLQPVSTEAATG